MKLRTSLALFGLLTALATTDLVAQKKPAAPPSPAGPVIVLETVKGTIEIELYEKDAPKSVAHILDLVRRNFYRGLRFHWVQAGIIQVGDPASRDMTKQDSWGKGGSGQPIGVAEISKRPWVRGTVGLAYLFNDPKQADSQFFINRAANPGLAGKYTMIGQVIKGMDVVDKIERADVLKLAYVKGENGK
jgi:cyclophilin family peptidyl-prolyl cis-trans isomerase